MLTRVRLRSFVGPLSVVVAVVLATTACSSNHQNSSPRNRSNSAVTSRPLTYSEVTKQGKNTPGEAILLLWFWAQWGSAPNVIGMYDPRVAKELGPGNISGLYMWLRGTLVDLRPRIGTVIRKQNLAFVAVEAETANAPPARYSFLLRRTRGNWLILYDTLLGDSLPGYIAYKIDGQVSAHPSARARQQGARLADRYRNLFLQAKARIPALR